MDSVGELVLAAGERSETHHLIAAHQGIALTRLRRLAERYGHGALRSLVFRHANGCVVLTPLRDGYYLVLTLGREADVARCVYASGLVQERMDQEL